MGVTGNRETAEKIEFEINLFLKSKLKLSFNTEKTKVINVHKHPVKFLGYKFMVTDREYYQSKIVKTAGGGHRRASFGTVKIYLPTEDIVKRLEEKGLVKNNKGCRYGPWVNYTDYEIIMKYKYILNGYLNYYRLSDDLYRFNRIGYLIKFSAAHTLATKHRMTLRQTFKKYGVDLGIKEGENRVSLSYK